MISKRILPLSLAQISIEPSNPTSNLAKTELYVQKAKAAGSEIVVFPELWTSGFNSTYLHKNAHEHLNTLDAVAALARKYTIWICGSLPKTTPHQKITNSCILFNSEGKEVSCYKKMHLFSPTIEERMMEAGDSLTLFKHTWGTSGFAICYDLRFPELFRSYALQGAELMFLVAAFPHPRLEHWMTLIRARAIENQMYMVCVNRVGTEQLEQSSPTFFGSSMVVNPWGEIIILGDQKEEMLLSAQIDLQLVETIRNDIPVFKDRKPHIYKL